MESTLRLLFGGDVSITGVYRDQIERGAEIFDQQLLDSFGQHDFIVINLEGPATSAAKITQGGEYVVNPPLTVPYLVSRGIKVFNCANNHMFDCGRPGFEETANLIDAAGGLRFGAGINASEAKRPLYLTGNGVTAALIGVCHFESIIRASATTCGVFDATIDDIRQIVNQARARSDYVILNYHAGEEYTTIPMPSRRRAILRLAGLGIDMIVGHHSHVMQGHERPANCDVFYSLGNFIFDVETHRRRHLTDASALVSVSLRKQGLSFEYIPISCDLRLGRIESGQEGFLDHIRAISDFSDYRKQWRRDAYRTYFQRRRVEETSNDDEQTSRGKRNKWQYLFWPDSYRRLYRQLRNANMRPIVVAGFEEAARRLLRRS